MRSVRFALALALVGFVACDPPAPPAAPVSASPALRCGTPLPGEALEPIVDAPRETGPWSPPVAGQMTEAAAQAKRLYDAEKWREAAVALARVAVGATGDDDGNRQLAQYHHAIALYRLNDPGHAASVFTDIARRANHIKRRETLLWIVKLADAAPVVVRAARFYSHEDVGHFANAEQRDVYWKALYLMGRERHERGLYDEAAGYFRAVPPESALHEAALECLARR